MDALAFSLRTLCQHNADGSHMTRAQRERGLGMVARELRQLGYRLPAATSLKPKHIQHLVARWRDAGISDATIKNRLGWVRWWAMKVSKPGLVPRDNAELGVGERTTFKGRPADATPRELIDRLPDERMRLAVRLQRAFGLRYEESLKFRVEEADKGAVLVLRPSWTKGGRARTVPVVHPGQRDLLDLVREVAGDGSLVPGGMTYIAYRRRMDRETLKAGATNLHRNRHWYARWRYRTLAGVLAPADGGPLHNDVSPAERARLDAVRMEVSRELGHGRLAVTDAYLGIE